LQKEPILISEEESDLGTDEVVSQAVTIETETDGVSAALVPYMVQLPYKQHYELPTFVLCADFGPL